MTLVCSAAKPLRSLDPVLGHGYAREVQDPDVELRIIVTTLGGKVIPLQCFSFVLRHPFAVFVQGPQVVLGEGIALIGCEAPPLCSLSVILRHTLAAAYMNPSAYCASALPWSTSGRQSRSAV